MDVTAVHWLSTRVPCKLIQLWDEPVTEAVRPSAGLDPAGLKRGTGYRRKEEEIDGMVGHGASETEVELGLTF